MRWPGPASRCCCGGRCGAGCSPCAASARPSLRASRALNVGSFHAPTERIVSTQVARKVVQLVFGFVNAPLFATFVLGMFWKRATGHGAFAGLLSGTLAAAGADTRKILEENDIPLLPVAAAPAPGAPTPPPAAPGAPPAPPGQG